MFERTVSGQQNRSVFLGVDYVCYVEGAEGKNGPDVTFWLTVFAKFRPDLRIRCIPRGGKPILESLARFVVERDIRDTLIAMDSDYDDFVGDKIIDSRVLYTYGYSWENDIYTVGNVSILYCALVHCGQLENEVREQIQGGFDSLGSNLARVVRADYLALRAGASVLPRDAPGRVVMSLVSNGRPSVRKTEVLSLVGVANVATEGRDRSLRFDWPRDVGRYCVGRIWSFAVQMLLRALVREVRRRASLSPDHVRDMALQTLTSFFGLNPPDPITTFHVQQCEAIGAAA